MKTILLLTQILFALFTVACNYAAVDSASITEKGIKQYEDEKYNVAMATFQTASERDPNNARAFYYMGLIDIFYHDYQAAVPKLVHATGIRSDAPIYWYTLSRAYALDAEKLMQDNLREQAAIQFSNCIRIAKKAVDLDPFYAEALLQKARCHVGVEEYNDAVEAYSASIQANPSLKSHNGVAEGYTELGQLYMKFGFYNEASVVLGNGLLNNSGNIQLEASIADVLFDLERYDEALAHYKAAVHDLENQGENRLHALNAMYGAGAACEELAKLSLKSKQDRKAYSQYEEAREWYDKYLNAALTDSENIRRAGATARIKDIDEILSNVSI